jgi:AcrR family transcriptional regulator
LEEIAQQYDFGKGIYNYYKSKEELFLGIINELAAKWLNWPAPASKHDRRSTAKIQG